MCARIGLEVTDGVVRLTGRVETKSLAQLAVAMSRRVDGVVAVLDGLVYDYDDTRIK